MDYAKFMTVKGKIDDAISAVFLVRDTELANKNSQKLTEVVRVRSSGRIHSNKIEQGQ